MKTETPSYHIFKENLDRDTRKEVISAAENAHKRSWVYFNVGKIFILLWWIVETVLLGMLVYEAVLSKSVPRYLLIANPILLAIYPCMIFYERFCKQKIVMTGLLYSDMVLEHVDISKNESNFDEKETITLDNMAWDAKEYKKKLLNYEKESERG